MIEVLLTNKGWRIAEHHCRNRKDSYGVASDRDIGKASLEYCDFE